MGYRRDDASTTSERTGTITRVLWGILFLNLVVAAAKLVWGVISGSVAMQADGFHSLFDGTSNVVGLIGIYLARRPADRDHPYGHNKFETYASAAIGAMLALAAYNVGSSAVAGLVADSITPPRVDAISFAVMLGTLGVNLAITTWERSMGRKLGSEVLVADASHTGSDVLVSLGVIAGLVAVRAGYPAADPLIAIGVSLAIAMTAWRVLTQAGTTLADTARVDPSDVCQAVLGIDGVLGCHHVRTRGSASQVYMDLHVQVGPELSVAQGHEIAERVERTICDIYPAVTDVLAHLEPFDEYQRVKTAEEIDAGLA
ncbi:MAG: cation transporter [Actinobacteria bacterium HGW-Actinobacteria-10]|nr:MAG: cation transporter [Actinobacteria bacterium HGW-Actinobacteria-10]